MTVTHSDAFKRDAVRIAQTSSLTRRQVASDLGAGHSTLGKWVRVFSEDAKVPAQYAELLRENDDPAVPGASCHGTGSDRSGKSGRPAHRQSPFASPSAARAPAGCGHSDGKDVPLLGPRLTFLPPIDMHHVVDTAI